MQIGQSQLDLITAAAISRWQAPGLSPELVDRLHRARVELADLPGDRVSMAWPDFVLFDPTAAGRGWFVDPSPGEDSEFASIASRIAGDVPQGLDLLSAVFHELGHVLGFEHADTESALGHPLSAELRPGMRTAAVDALLSLEW
jgi:hypothetical protein